MQGLLYSGDFLRVGVTGTGSWNAMSRQSVDTFATELAGILNSLSLDSSLNEAATEDEVILKVLHLLGWTDLLRQQTAAKRREDVPDILLFPDAVNKSKALGEKHEDRRYRHGVVIV